MFMRHDWVLWLSLLCTSITECSFSSAIFMNNFSFTKNAKASKEA
jgi:hypothetical protein